MGEHDNGCVAHKYLEKQLDTLEKTTSNLTEKIEELPRLIDKIEYYLDTTKTIQLQLKTIDEMRNDLTIVKEKTKNYDEMRGEFKEIQSSLNYLKSEIGQIQSVQKSQSPEEQQKQINEINNTLNTFLTNHTVLNETIKNLSDEVKKLSEIKTNLNKNSNEVVLLQEQMKELQEVRKDVKDLNKFKWQVVGLATGACMVLQIAFAILMKVWK